jgi:hypothetical protein
MHAGRSLTDIAAELTRQIETRKDYVAPQGALEAKVLDGEVVIDGINGQPFGITPHAHGQIADHLGIPAKYYSRMREQKPALLAENVNEWLRDNGGDPRMVRTLDGKVRAFLSPKYRPLDNYALAASVLPVLQEKKVKVLSAELTDTRLYIKGILPELSDPLPDGLTWGSGHNDITKVVQGLQLNTAQAQLARIEGRGRLVAAITISNSEVGAGTLRVEPSVFTTWCTNLAILKQASMKKYHVGRAWEADEGFEVFEDDTRKADDEAFFLKVRDVTKAAFSRDKFDAAVQQILESGARRIESGNLQKVVDVTVRQLALPVSTSGNILQMLAAGGDLSQWGLSSAITALANTAESYELATQLEYAGGEVLALDDKGWAPLGKAA